jgi:hypothetical protein
MVRSMMRRWWPSRCEIPMTLRAMRCRVDARRYPARRPADHRQMIDAVRCLVDNSNKGRRCC